MLSWWSRWLHREEKAKSGAPLLFSSLSSFFFFLKRLKKKEKKRKIKKDSKKLKKWKRRETGDLKCDLAVTSDRVEVNA